MLLATFISGVIWLLDIVFFKPRRRLPSEGGAAIYAREPLLAEYARAFFPVLLVVLLLRSFLYEPFKIPSGSMMPTLLTGDFILVNKFAYGVRLPVVEREVLAVGRPQRGDAVVFRYPNDASLDYIKRVIGIPGDEIAYINKTLAINGVKIDKLPRGPYRGEDYELLSPPVEMYQEHIGEHVFDTLEQPRKAGLEGIIEIPAGHYFVMGDNRDNSNDSRYWGFVGEDDLVGRAEWVWMSWDSEDFAVRWNRLFRAID